MATNTLRGLEGEMSDEFEFKPISVEEYQQVIHTTGELSRSPVTRVERKHEPKDFEFLLQDVIGTFISIRDQRKALEEMVTNLKEKEAEAEEELWNLMEQMKLKSVKSDEYGTVSRSVYMLPFVANEESFMTWIRATNNYQLIQDRVRMRELRVYIEEQEQIHNPEALPPGVELKLDKRISIRSIKGGRDDGER
jgi:hypothetical protein